MLSAISQSAARTPQHADKPNQYRKHRARYLGAMYRCHRVSGSTKWLSMSMLRSPVRPSMSSEAALPEEEALSSMVEVAHLQFANLS